MFSFGDSFFFCNLSFNKRPCIFSYERWFKKTRYWAITADSKGLYSTISFLFVCLLFNEAFISITLIKAEKNIAEIISRFESFQLRSVVYWVYGITFLTDRSPGVEYEPYCVQIDPLRFRLAQGLVCCSRNIVELFNAHIVFRLQRLIKR